MGGRRLKTRAEAFLKWAVNLEVFISRFCGTTELSMGLAGGPFTRDYDSGGPQEAVKSWFSAEAQVNRSAHCTAPSLCTYSGTSPKPGAARASAAKILQYSRLMFWIDPTSRLWFKLAWHLLSSLGSVPRRPTLKVQSSLGNVWLFQGDYSSNHQDDQSPKSSMG